MIREGDLEIYDIEFEVVTPVHVGNGNSIEPYEYLYDPRTRIASPIDYDKFFDLLIEKNATDDYEAFTFDANRNIDDFLTHTLELSNSEINRIKKYRVDASDVDNRFRRRNGRILKQRINEFQRNHKGQPYIPGSGIKGALRTAILARLLLKELKADKTPAELSRLINDFERNEVRRHEIAKYAKKLESALLNTLDLYRAKDNSKDILRGISISDSLPLSNDDLILVGREDVQFDGRINSINVISEAIKPGTKVKAKLTIDRKIVGDTLTIKDILFSINYQSDFLTNEIDIYFDTPRGTFRNIPESYLNLGGITGFFIKTIIYEFYDNEVPTDFSPAGEDNFYRAVEIIRDYMSHKFYRHHHEEIDQDISPHTKNYTYYNNRYYPMGYTKVTVK